MTKKEYLEKVEFYEAEIKRNKMIKCNRVAAKFERWLAKLRKEYGKFDID